MTSDNIKKVQIIATIDDGSHILAVSDDNAAWCPFIKVEEELFEQCSQKELEE